ncbi:MAG: lipopolysaccharide heptosyltransferase II [Candidatus Omnitrophota bacterium]|nr:lipopolysaccharide heptosyltransferase II [Candidatus Omnitrophota bacterium]
MINKILFITLSNIGDAIMTLPALDQLVAVYPRARITVITAARPREIFENHPAVNKVIVYDKRSRPRDQIKLCLGLRKENFDMVVDLRNTFLGALIFSRRKIPLFLRIPRNLRHMRDIHLYKTQAAIRSDSFVGTGLKPVPTEGYAKDFVGTAYYAVPTGNLALAALGIRPQDKEYIERKLKESGITGKDKIVVIAAGARSHIKRWPKERFAELIPLITRDTGARVVLAGDNQDLSIAAFIAGNVKGPVLNLSGATTIMQLAVLLKKASLLVTNDSAVLHLAGYLNTPTVAIFGPTDETRYGPWSSTSGVVKKEVFCRPCAKAQCRFGTLDCMNLIKVQDVLRAVKKILNTDDERPLDLVRLCSPQVARGKRTTNDERHI